MKVRRIPLRVNIESCMLLCLHGVTFGIVIKRKGTDRLSIFVHPVRSFPTSTLFHYQPSGASETPWNSYTAGRFPSLLNVMPKMLEADGEESSYWKANTSLREKIPGPQLPGEQRCSRLQLVYRVPRGRDKGELISEGCLGFIF